MKIRSLHTKIWEKEFFTSKSKDAKLLFIYLLTNSRIGFCGAYEITDRVIMFDIGLDSGELEAAKKELFPKVVFFEGWVYVKNAQKYSNYSSPKMEKPKQAELDALPEKIKRCFVDGVCDIPQGAAKKEKKEVAIVKAEPMEANMETWEGKTPSEQMKAFLENRIVYFGDNYARVRDVIRNWMTKTWGVSEGVAMNEMGKFVAYWTEPTASGKKMRWQTEKTFEVKRRFVTWMNRKHGNASEALNNKYQVQDV